MWTVIISTLILSTMVIGLGIKLLTILNFLERPNTLVWQLITVVVFLPSIYSLLSVSKLVFGNIYLYYLLAILVFYYISPAIGSLYFVLTPIVIILYLDMILQKPLPIDIPLLVFASGFLNYGATWLISFLKKPAIVKVSLAAVVMLVLERLFGYFLPAYGLHTAQGIFIATMSAIFFIIAVDRFNRSLIERKEDVDDLTLQANKDELTQFYNLYHLNKDFSSRQLNRQTLAIAVIDLDYFKTVNDQHGHSMGNQVLVTFSQHLHQCLTRELGENNFELYRYGGEEFVVTIKTLKEKSMEALFDIADKLLYVAKTSGREQTRIEVENIL
ncbi:GGDEF domain-containing protein [Leuconostoc citreum]|uniref:GGDEF domain-containing protein n=1 Tax=Leuconostoc citreum TaxID=33964 RepID=UPI000246623C|nr:GGDEF domain-containing protein [Leuconostoc citreum]CCF26207.1 GGDEF domain protein [Leuconostoc citreum LBAE C11]